MPRILSSLTLAAALAAATSAASAADDDELRQLRAEIAALRQSYDARIAELEARLQRAAPAGPAATAPSAAAREFAVAPATPAPAAARAGAFNPEVSLILQGQYRRMKDIDERAITGFVASDDEHEDEGEGPQRGFSLDHTELVLAANIDTHFRGLANFALIDGEVEVEEAWFQTTGLGHGLGVKAGRFLSGIGYANEQHPHQFDFADPALMYTALFGEHGNYGNDGLQFRWVAPTTTFVELGAEIGRGANFPGTDRNINGIGSHALFAHVGSDVGTSHSWRAGLSWLATRARDRESHFEDVATPLDEVPGNFRGTSRTWLADMVWKWAPDGNPTRTNLTVQAEYFQRRERGDLTCAADDPADCGALVDSIYRTRQSGWYAQSVYQFMPRWRAGVRYDRLDSGQIDYGANNANLAIADHRPSRTSLMLDYNPSEFSRVRLQFARDKAMQGITDDQVWLQYVMSLGAHGAHSF